MAIEIHSVVIRLMVGTRCDTSLPKIASVNKDTREKMGLEHGWSFMPLYFPSSGGWMASGFFGDGL